MESRRKNSDDHIQMQSLTVPKVHHLNVCETVSHQPQELMHKIHRSLLGVQLDDRLGLLEEVIDDRVERVVYVHFKKRLISNALKYLDSHQTPKFHQLREGPLPTLAHTAQPYIPQLQLHV